MFVFDTISVRFCFFLWLELIQINCGIVKLNLANVIFIVLIDSEVNCVFRGYLKFLEIIILLI
jgi:hypothetical protein